MGTWHCALCVFTAVVHVHMRIPIPRLRKLAVARAAAAHAPHGTWPRNPDPNSDGRVPRICHPYAAAAAVPFPVCRTRTPPHLAPCMPLMRVELPRTAAYMPMAMAFRMAN